MISPELADIHFTVALMNKIFDVMLEGIEADAHYFVTYRVVAASTEEAKSSALKYAEDADEEILACEEIEGIDETDLPPGFLQKTGRSFFGTDDQ